MSDVISTDRLTKYYGTRCVVNQLNLRVPRGCVYGLLGRNGAGKSTTIKMLMGMVQPDSGEAHCLGIRSTISLPSFASGLPTSPTAPAISASIRLSLGA